MVIVPAIIGRGFTWLGPTADSTSGMAFTTDGTGNVTLAFQGAGTLTGATLAANVLASSLTSVGTLTGGATGAGFTVALATSTISGALPDANVSNATKYTIMSAITRGVG